MCCAPITSSISWITSIFHSKEVASTRCKMLVTFREPSSSKISHFRFETFPPRLYCLTTAFGKPSSYIFFLFGYAEMILRLFFSVLSKDPSFLTSVWRHIKNRPIKTMSLSNRSSVCRAVQKMFLRLHCVSACKIKALPLLLFTLPSSWMRWCPTCTCTPFTQ